MPSPIIAGGDQQTLAKRDGCDCPAWVLRCAHFDGRVLHLIDRKQHVELCKYSAPEECLWSVADGTAGDSPGHIQAQGDPLRTDDLPSAIAEFEKRELQLLGREA